MTNKANLEKPKARDWTVYAWPAAAFLALGVALWSVLGVRGSVGRNAGVAAYVNSAPVPEAEYHRALSAMQAGLERPLTVEDKARALRILIDEELIVQEALKLDLARDDRLVRKNLIQALMTSATRLDSDTEVSEGDLRRFYEAEQQLFVTPKLVTVQVAKAGTEVQAKNFLAFLQDGASFADARVQAGLTGVDAPPGLPLSKLGDYLGGPARDAVVSMLPGDIIGPVPSGDNALFIWLTDTQGGFGSFEEVKESVVAEWSRRREEEALAKYVGHLRRQARIRRIIDPVAEQ